MLRKMFLAIAEVLIYGQVIFAGQFVQNNNGFYYIQDDGTVAKSKWITNDIDADGKEEYYYFDENGSMVINDKTPDGYDVNEKGQWIKDGKVQIKNDNKNGDNRDSSISGIYKNAYKDTMDAYNKGLDVGQKAVEAGLDAGQKVVEAGIDVVGDMYGGILKGAVNEYKKEYNKAMDEYKSEYNKAMDDYKKEINSAMNDYQKEFNSVMSQYKSALGSFGW